VEKEKMKFLKLMKNKKAISPIFASLILIAIAVIAGIVVYMFTSGTIGTLTGGGAAAQEKAAVQGVTVLDGTTNYLNIYASCVEGGPITITGVLVKDLSGNTVAAPALGTGSEDTLSVAGDLVTITTAEFANLDPTMQYTVTLTSSNGGSFVSSSFKP
jgi:flagellin-like protein